MFDSMEVRLKGMLIFCIIIIFAGTRQASIFRLAQCYVFTEVLSTLYEATSYLESLSVRISLEKPTFKHDIVFKHTASHTTMLNVALRIVSRQFQIVLLYKYGLYDVTVTFLAVASYFYPLINASNDSIFSITPVSCCLQSYYLC